MSVAILGAGLLGAHLADHLEADFAPDLFDKQARAEEVVGTTNLQPIETFKPGDYTWVINCLPVGVNVEAPANGVLIDWSGSQGVSFLDGEPEPGARLAPLPALQFEAMRVLQAVGLERVLSADFTALVSASFTGQAGTDTLASQTAKLLNGMGRDAGDWAFDLGLVDESPAALLGHAELMPYQIGWKAIRVPVFHGCALSFSILSNQSLTDLEARFESLGIDRSETLNLQALIEDKATRQLSGLQSDGPRATGVVAFDPLAQMLERTRELLDRPL